MGVDVPASRSVFSAAKPQIVFGAQHFRSQRLNILQIGLGTFGTFFQNLAKPGEDEYFLTWLLEAASNKSTGLLGVGVEPVPEHVARLRPILEHLPNASLVQAAIGNDDKRVSMHAITQEHMEACLQKLSLSEQEAFASQLIYLRNMSCVGQEHPQFSFFSESLEQQFGMKVKMEALDAISLSYASLAQMLGFSGVEILVIDAEGHDCEILQSMIDYCKLASNNHSWPQVIQFETMGHNNDVGIRTAEQDMIQSLVSCGYRLVCTGNDTNMVHGPALSCETRLQEWVGTLKCGNCGSKGECGMPFSLSEQWIVVCHQCNELQRAFGSHWWDRWQRVPVSVETGDVQVISVTSDREFVWTVGVDGRWC